MRLQITNRNARVDALQERWNWLRRNLDQLLRERGVELADAPGGSTGLLVRDYKGKDANKPVYRIDTAVVALFAELRAQERQAAQELGQWADKREIGIKRLKDMTEEELRELVEDGRQEFGEGALEAAGKEFRAGFEDS